ncbi:DUF2059 domain-containing protein [Glaciecola sp. MF2-115]|uniref:DUF2059 domain-containing protein n=1 Tax=Glaciecola sp. MF2-115 TaxID=3384827 RepID=UPI0039A33A90
MKILLLTLILLFSLTANAQVVTTEKDKLDELLDIMKLDETMDLMFTQMRDMQTDMLKGQDMSAEESAVHKDYLAKLSDLFKAELSFEIMREEFKRIYRQNFTEQEIEEILAFYRSPAGQSVLRTMPVVMQESMQVAQRAAQNLMPKVQALVEQRSKALRELQEAQ